MMTWLEIILWLHGLTVCAMVGIIWFVQIVHYPLFLQVGEQEYHHYHSGHLARTGILIAPLMLTEMGTGILLLALLAVTDVSLLAQPQWFTASMVVLGVIWVSTFFVQVRYHHALDHGKNETAIRRLTLTNWLRTILWTVRIPLLIAAIS